MLYSSHTEINFFERDEVFLVKLTKDNLYQTVDTQYQAHKESQTIFFGILKWAGRRFSLPHI